MTEQAPNPNQEHGSNHESLQDESAYVRQHLARLMEQGAPFAAQTEGLYISMPGKTYRGSTFIDKGCRGGWSESYQAALGDEPAELSLIQRRYNKLDFRLAGGGHTTLAPEELAQASFLVDPMRWQAELPDNQTDQAIQARLRSAPYVSLSYEDVAQATDWQHAIYVRSRYPLEHPICHGRLDSHDAMEYGTLNGTFDSIETYFDPNTATTMAQVTVSEGRLRQDTVATPWVPLDQLHFEAGRLSDRAAYDIRMGQLAAALCSGDTDTAPINQLLQQIPSLYRLPYRTRTSRGELEQVIVGQANSDGIGNITAAPLARPEAFRDISLDAERVVYDHHQPWVVSPSGLSVPLKQQGQFERNQNDRGLRAERIDSLIEQAKRHAK